MKFILTLLALSATIFANAQFRAIGLAKNQQCINNLKQLGLAYQLFLNDNGKGPEQLKDLESCISPAILTCPNAKKEKDYILVPDFGIRKDNFPAAFDRIGNHPNEINVVYCNGRTETLRYTGNQYSNMLSLFKGLNQNEQKKLAEFLRSLDKKK